MEVRSHGIISSHWDVFISSNSSLCLRVILFCQNPTHKGSKMVSKRLTDSIENIHT